MQIYRFEILYYDEDDKPYRRQGLVCGNSIGDAANLVVEQYSKCGDIDFSKLTLSPFNTGVLLFNPEIDIYSLIEEN